MTLTDSTTYSISDVPAETGLVRGGDDTTAERLELLVAHRERVLAQLAEVQRSLTAIDYKIDTYERLCS